MTVNFGTCLSDLYLPSLTPPVLPASPHSSPTATDGGDVAGCSAAEHEVLWDAGGVCFTGNWGSPTAADRQAEESSATGSEGQGLSSLLFIQISREYSYSNRIQETNFVTCLGEVNKINVNWVPNCGKFFECSSVIVMWEFKLFGLEKALKKKREVGIVWQVNK